MMKNLEVSRKQLHILTLWHGVPISCILFQRYAKKYKMTDE